MSENASDNENALLAQAQSPASGNASQDPVAAGTEDPNAPVSGPKAEGQKDGQLLPKSDLVQLCRAYVNSKDDEIGEEIITLASNSDAVNEHNSPRILDLLFASETEHGQVHDRIVGAILSHPRGRAALATRMTTDPTANFRSIWTLGEMAMDGLTRTCLAHEAWQDSESRVTAVKDTFLLLLSVLLEPGHEKYEIAMKAIARLMAVDASALESSIDADNLAIVFSFLDIQKPVGLRSQATLITAKFLEASHARGETLLREYVLSRIAQKTIDDVVAGFSVASAIFPIVPQSASSLFLLPGLLDDVISSVKKSKSNRLRLAALELLSAACINKECRLSIKTKCTEWLRDVVKDPKASRDSALAALVLSKSGHEPEPSRTPKVEDLDDDLTATFSSLILDTEESQLQTAVEGLAYCSIQAKSREDISMDEKLLKKITEAIVKPENRGPLVFGALTIFSNLTAYPPEESAEQKRMAQLKAYANQTKVAETNPLDDPPRVTNRCKKLLDAGVVPALGKIVKRVSPTLCGLIAQVILNLSKERKHCGTLVQQGVLDFILPLASYAGSDATLVTVRKTAAQALARTIIPIDPFLVFSNYQNTPNARSIANAIRALKVLLDDHDSQDPRPAFEALQALTNLASMGEEVCEFITSITFSSIETYLVSSRSALQQAATECISNLSGCPSCIDQFVVADDVELSFPSEAGSEVGSDHPKEDRFLRLRSLSEDGARGTRLAAMATFFNLTQLASGARMLLGCPSGLERLLLQLDHASITNASSGKVEPDTDMLVRTVGVICNILQHGGKDAREGLHALDLRKALKEIKTEDQDSPLYQFKMEALEKLDTDVNT